MKKRNLLLLILSILLVTAAGAKEKKGKKSSKKNINIYSFNEDVPKLANKFLESHPDYKYNFSTFLYPQADDIYKNVITENLESNDENSPDIFCIEIQDLYKFTKGEYSKYVMPVTNLGIDIDAKIEEAELAKYMIDLGRNSDGDVVGLGYESSSGAFIYRRSIAKKVFGTDDPAVIQKRIGGGENSWNKFFMAASVLSKSGYPIVSSIEDLWLPFENSADKGWIVDGKLYIDPKREAFLDYVKTSYEKGYLEKTVMWRDDWFNSFRGSVFGFFGPAWFLNYVISYNIEDPSFDLAVCESPVGFYWGGTWIFVNKNLKADKKAAVKELIEWLTLDSSDAGGALYIYAEGEDIGSKKQTVVSGKVMKNIDGRLDVLDGQNMYDVYIKANQSPNGTNLSEFDNYINVLWLEQVKLYADGNKSRAKAIADFKRGVNQLLGIEY